MGAIGAILVSLTALCNSDEISGWQLAIGPVKPPLDRLTTLPLIHQGSDVTPVDQHSMDIVSRLRRKVEYSLFRQHWNLAVTPYPASIVAGLEGNDRQRRALEELCWMPERRDAFAADPFIVRDTATPDECLIYYEHFPWKFDRGSINSVRLASWRVC